MDVQQLVAVAGLWIRVAGEPVDREVLDRDVAVPHIEDVPGAVAVAVPNRLGNNPAGSAASKALDAPYADRLEVSVPARRVLTSS